MNLFDGELEEVEDATVHNEGLNPCLGRVNQQVVNIGPDLEAKGGLDRGNVAASRCKLERVILDSTGRINFERGLVA